jgi:hypothetical protein
MKISFLLPLMVLAAVAIEAEETQTSRTLLRIGLLLTRGDDTGWSDLQPGLTINALTYFDAAAPDGWYYGILGSALSRAAGGVVLADTRLVTLGWRGNPLAWLVKGSLPIQLDAGAAPTIGSRIAHSTVLGSMYTGIGVTLGLGIPIIDGQDLGVSWEPVFPLLSWGQGDAHAPNRGYTDFVISWTIKSFFETRSLGWSSR